MIVFKKGLDLTFFNLLLKLYDPFLSSLHIKDNIQLTIHDNDISESPIGFIQYNTKNRFIQIALIPNLRSKGLGIKIITKFLKRINTNNINWTASNSNLPSLKLLYNLGGGAYYKSLSNDTMVYGYYQGKVKSEDRNTLKEIIDTIATAKFEKWQRLYNKKTSALKAVFKYLERNKLSDDLLSNMDGVTDTKLHKLTTEDINHYLDLYRTIEDKAHGVDHILVVIKKALELARRLKYKKIELVRAAALLHDIGMLNNRETHQLVGETLILNDIILKKRFTKNEILEIAHAVRSHRASDKTVKPKTTLAKIINDADRMDSGITRAYLHNKFNRPDLSDVQLLLEAGKHIVDKYGPNGYGLLSLQFKESKAIILESISPISEAMDNFNVVQLATLSNVKLIRQQGPTLTVNNRLFPKQSNVIFVTGLSGSGKTTAAKELVNKYKAEYIALDSLEHSIYNKYMVEFLKNHPVFNKKNRAKKTSVPEILDMLKLFMTWLMNEIKNSNKLFVVEGVQLYQLFTEIVINNPVIVINTTVDNCIIGLSIRGTGGYSPSRLIHDRIILNEFINQIKIKGK